MKVTHLRRSTLGGRQLAFAYRVGLYPTPASAGAIHPPSRALARPGAKATSRPPPRGEPLWLRLPAYGAIVTALTLFALGREAPALGLFGLTAVTWSIAGVRHRRWTGEPAPTRLTCPGRMPPIA